MDDLESKLGICFEKITSIEQNWISKQEALMSKLDALIDMKTPNQEKKKARLRNSAKNKETEVNNNGLEASLSFSQRPKRTAKERASVMLRESKRSLRLRQPATVKLEPMEALTVNQKLSVIGYSEKPSDKGTITEIESNKVVKIERGRTRFKRITQKDSKNSSTESILLENSRETVCSKENQSVEILSAENSIVLISDDERGTVEDIKTADEEGDRKNLVKNVSISGRITRSRIKAEKEVLEAAPLQVPPKRNLRSSKQIKKPFTEHSDKTSTETSFASIIESPIIVNEPPLEDADKNVKEDNNNQDKSVEDTIYEDAASDNLTERSTMKIDEKEKEEKISEEIPKPDDINCPTIVQNETFTTHNIHEKPEMPSDATFAIITTESDVVPEIASEMDAKTMVVISDATFCAKAVKQQIDSEVGPPVNVLNSDLPKVLLNKIKCSEHKVATKNHTPILQRNKTSSKLTKQCSRELRNNTKLQQKRDCTPTSKDRLYCTPDSQITKKLGVNSVPLKKLNSNSKPYISPNIGLKSNSMKRVPLVRSNSVKNTKSKLQDKQGSMKEQEKKHLNNKIQPLEEVRKNEKENMEIKQQKEYLQRLEHKRLEAEKKEKQRQERQIMEENIQKVFQERQNNLVQSSQVVHNEQKTPNPYNFDIIHSGDSSDGEGKIKPNRPPIPIWSRKRVRHLQIDRQGVIPMAIIDSFFSVKPLNPDLAVIFPAINPEYLKRNSSVVWNTPPRYSQLPKY